MDPEYSAQDVYRCDICEIPGPPLCCDLCHIHLCKVCVADHLLDGSKEHKVVSFDLKGSTINYPKCLKHSTKICELHCEQCDVPICSICISSKEHNTHDVIDILKNLNTKKEAIRRDLQELENSIYPRFQKAVSNIPVQTANIRKNSQKMKTTLKEQGEALHKEIDNVIQKIQTEIDGMDSTYLRAIDQQEDGISNTITEIKQSIADIKKMLDSDDVHFISAYKSRNEEFRGLPAQFHVTLPTFTPQEINSDQISQLFDSLTKLAIRTEDHGGPIQTPGAVSSPQARLLIDEPRILTDIKTEYEMFRLRSVSCLSDSEFWTCCDSIMRLFNLQGELLKSVQTKSGNWPEDIAVTRSRDLVYTDYKDRSINIIKNTQIQTLIRLQGWKPCSLCITSSGDLLVSMITDDNKQCKVARYSGSTEKQIIQWDGQGKSLYSSGTLSYLSENRNLDICVADYRAGAVVVVSATSELRFRYIGPPSATKKPFTPVGITTDSQCNILTADNVKHCIHIIDQDGHFLRYIDNCDLQAVAPEGLCVDSRDNLFVAEYDTGKVKKIQYYM